MACCNLRVVIPACRLRIELLLQLLFDCLFGSSRWIWLGDCDLHWVFVCIEYRRAWSLRGATCSSSHQCAVLFVAEEIHFAFDRGWNLLSSSLSGRAILACCSWLYHLQIGSRFFTEEVWLLIRIFGWMGGFCLVLWLLALVYWVVMGFVLGRGWVQIVCVILGW